MLEVDLVAAYLFIVLAFCAGFVACAVLTFSRWCDKAFDVETPEIDEHA